MNTIEDNILHDQFDLVLDVHSSQLSFATNGFEFSTSQLLVLFYMVLENLLSNPKTKALEPKVLLVLYY